MILSLKNKHYLFYNLLLFLLLLCYWSIFNEMVEAFLIFFNILIFNIFRDIDFKFRISVKPKLKRNITFYIFAHLSSFLLSLTPSISCPLPSFLCPPSITPYLLPPHLISRCLLLLLLALTLSVPPDISSSPFLITPNSVLSQLPLSPTSSPA